MPAKYGTIHRRLPPAGGGLNAGIAASDGEVVARLDAHAELPPGYLRRAAELLDSAGAANVGGVQQAVGRTPFEQAVAVAMTSKLGTGDAKFHYGGTAGPVDTVYLGVFRRDVLERLGGLLFELSNQAPARALAIEYDQDKADLANEIAELAEIPQVRFEQDDIDTLEPSALGKFDIVLALAIESHVLDPDRLYWLLGEVAGTTLCFEGNAGNDIESARHRLEAVGFTAFAYLGFCDDDIDPRNNRRPQLLAHKAPKQVPLGARLRNKLRRRSE